jgi:hypothetical protein
MRRDHTRASPDLGRASGEPLVDSSNVPAICLIVIAAIILSRAPNLVIDPRLWIDEATFYYAYASQHNLIRSLLFVSTDYASYLVLAANIPATAAAHVFPIQLAPAVTTLWAFLVQIGAFAIVLFGKSLVWRTNGQRIAVCGLLLFGPPLVHPEIWLNSTNSQVFCGVIGVLLLCERTDGRSSRAIWLQRAALLFCALSGPYTSFLAPAFILKARTDRSSESRIQAGVVLAAFVLQTGIYLWTRTHFPFSPNRLFLGDWSVRLAYVAYNVLVYPIAGYDLAPVLARNLGLLGAVNRPDWPLQYLRLVGWASAMALALSWWIFGRKISQIGQRILLTAFVCSTVLVFFFAQQTTGRYAAVPGTLTLLVCFSSVLDVGSLVRSRICRALLTLSLLAGVATFWRDVPPEFSPLGRAPGRPSWHRQVEAWQRDPHHRLRVWPYTSALPQRLALLPKDSGTTGSVWVRVPTFSMISDGEETARSVPVDGLPIDFRLVVRYESTQPSKLTRFEVHLDDGEGVSMWRMPIRGFQWHQDYWLNVSSAWGMRLPRGRDFDEVRAIRFVLQSSAGIPQRVAIKSAHVGPRVVGAFEDLLPGPQIQWTEIDSVEAPGTSRRSRSAPGEPG